MSNPAVHNPDNLASPGDPPRRFLVKGEQLQHGDEQWIGNWFKVSRALIHVNPNPSADFTYRTRRPLPAAPSPTPREVELIYNFLLPVLEPWCLLNQIREKAEQLAALLAQHRSARVRELEDALKFIREEVGHEIVEGDFPDFTIAEYIDRALNPPTQ